MHAGPGYGGSCFPKDTVALTRAGQKYGASQRIVETVVSVNEDRKARMADKIIEACGEEGARGKKVGILGVAFKPNTDDMRDAPALTIVPILQQAGAEVSAYDPEAMEAAAEMIDDVTWCKNAYDVAQGVDVLVILTEWNEFRALDMKRIGDAMAGNTIVDLRNIYKIDEMRGKGFNYVSVGRSRVESEEDEDVYRVSA